MHLIDDEDFKVWSSWRIRNLDIFNADLVGELNHKEWTKERKKIDDIISEFKMNSEIAFGESV